MVNSDYTVSTCMSS